MGLVLRFICVGSHHARVSWSPQFTGCHRGSTSAQRFASPLTLVTTPTVGHREAVHRRIRLSIGREVPRFTKACGSGHRLQLVAAGAVAPIAPIAWHRRAGNRLSVRPSTPPSAATRAAAATAARDRGPTQRAQTGRAGVTGSGEGGRQENQVRARSLCSLQFLNRMGGTGDHAGWAKRFRPVSAAQVNASFQAPPPAAPPPATTSASRRARQIRARSRPRPPAPDRCRAAAPLRPCPGAGRATAARGSGRRRSSVNSQRRGRERRLAAQPPGEKLQVHRRGRSRQIRTITAFT